MEQIQVKLETLSDVKCLCSNGTFEQIVFLKMIPGLLVGKSKNDVLPVPAFRCTRCKNVLDLEKALQKTPDGPQKIIK